MKITKYVLIIALSVVVNWSQAQDDDPFQAPNVIPSNPLASQYEKHLGFPVSTATGLAQINIPLYNFDVSGVVIPFSLSYHSSGIKVEDDAGMIGYGWTLFPGLRISRRIMGNPDDLCPTYDRTNISSGFSWGNANIANAYFANSNFGLTGVQPNRDTQYDIFTLNLLDKSVTFIMEWEGDEVKYTTIPESPIKIESTTISTSGSPLSEFIVTDEKGIVYTYGGADLEYRGTTDVAVGGVNNEWRLKEIDPLGPSNNIYFHYDRERRYQSTVNSASYYIDDIPDDGGNSPPMNNSYSTSPVNSNSPHFQEHYSRMMTSITSDEGSGVVFTYDDTNIETARISGIIFTTPYQTTPVETVVFDRDYSDYDERKLLESVTTTRQGTYEFEYNSQRFEDSRSQDLYGYYNGKENLSTLVPKFDIASYTSEAYPNQSVLISIGDADRSTVEEKMKANILEKVIYPTGGRSTFEHEAHRYLSCGSESFGAGLRIKQIDTYDPVSGKTLTKRYEYGELNNDTDEESESGLGELGTYYPKSNHPSAGTCPSELDETAFISEVLWQNHVYVSTDNGEAESPAGYYCQSFRRRTVSSHSKYGVFSFDIPVWYSRVAEYNSENNDEGKKVYYYNYQGSYYSNENVLPDDSRSQDNYSITTLRNLGTNSPRLVGEEYYDSDNNLLREVVNQYSYGPYSTLSSYVIQSVVSCGTTYITALNGNLAANLVDCMFDFKPYLTHGYTIQMKTDYLLSSIQRDYLQGGMIETETTYSYDMYNLISKTTSTNNNEEIRERYYYPSSDDLSADWSGSLPNDWDSNILTLMEVDRKTTQIGKITDKGDGTNPISKVLYRYMNDAINAIYEPETVYSASGLEDLEARVNFNKYDNKGNLLEVAKKNDIVTSYIWGYDETLPVAKIENFSYDNLSSTSYVNALQNTSDLDDDHCLSGEPCNEDALRDVQTGLRTWLPENAMLTTYTYDPLIGMTSQTDPRGLTTYYEYDNEGRLFQVKDQDGNILSKNLYHKVTDD